MLRAKITKFLKTSCWPAGPCKPNDSVVEGTAAQIKTAVDTAMSDIGSLTAGESLQVIITFKED